MLNRPTQGRSYPPPPFPLTRSVSEPPTRLNLMSDTADAAVSDSSLRFWNHLLIQEWSIAKQDTPVCFDV